MEERTFTTWDEFLELSKKSYDEAIEILTSYKLLKKSDSDWSINAYKWGYVVWLEDKKEVVITKEGLDYMLECCKTGIDENAKVFSQRCSKYDSGRKLIEKFIARQQMNGEVSNNG